MRSAGYVSEIFVSFQGEGLHAGRRQLFLRMGGCHLRCRYCDTPGSLERAPQYRVFGSGTATEHANPVEPDRLAALNQPGADLLRRVFAAASGVADASTARVLETLRDDPDFRHLERIVAEPPLGIETEDAAALELKASLEHLGKDAERAADAERILRGHRPGTGPA